MRLMILALCAALLAVIAVPARAQTAPSTPGDTIPGANPADSGSGVPTEKAVPSAPVEKDKEAPAPQEAPHSGMKTVKTPIINTDEANMFRYETPLIDKEKPVGPPAKESDKTAPSPPPAKKAETPATSPPEKDKGKDTAAPESSDEKSKAPAIPPEVLERFGQARDSSAPPPSQDIFGGYTMTDENGNQTRLKPNAFGGYDVTDSLGNRTHVAPGSEGPSPRELEMPSLPSGDDHAPSLPGRPQLRLRGTGSWLDE